MAAITIDENAVALVRVNENGMQSFPANAAFGAATYVTINAAGRAVAGGGAGGYLAIKAAKNAGDAVTAIRDGIVDVGDGLSGLAYGASVYSTPAGALDDAATGNTRVGSVAPGYGHTSGDKLLRVEL